tara:strand:- start:388 stop:558 length:171 start_codon:yes stop_codon:yes gene_type:complete
MLFDWLSIFRKEIFVFCVKCKKKVKVLRVQYVNMEGGQKRVKGICNTCKKKVSCFV